LITETRLPSVLTNWGATTSDQEDAGDGAQGPICRLWIRRASTGVMTRVAGERHLEYELTDKGTALWPVVLSLMSWGDDFCAPSGPRRLFRHAADGGQVDRGGRCDACGRPVLAADTIIAPGPGLEPPADDDSRITAALTRPHRLLEPLRAADAPAAP
jgi:hypothetical protein